MGIKKIKSRSVEIKSTESSLAFKNLKSIKWDIYFYDKINNHLILFTLFHIITFQIEFYYLILILLETILG